MDVDELGQWVWGQQLLSASIMKPRGDVGAGKTQRIKEE